MCFFVESVSEQQILVIAVKLKDHRLDTAAILQVEKR